MNEAILNMWIESNQIQLDSEQMSFINPFIKLMDKHSLRLNAFNSAEKTFQFTNDAETLEFTFAEMKQHVDNLKNGIAFPWSSYEN